MGLAEPSALAFSSLFAVLVVLYLWERRRRRVTVPSLLLWQAVREDVLRARRFRPDLLFVLQALLLAALILGLARPYRLGTSAAPVRGRHVFVLDTTASTQALEGRHTRFDELRARAHELLDSLHQDDEVMIVRAGRTAEVELAFSRDRAAAARTLDALRPTDIGGNLEAALSLVTQAQRHAAVPTQIHVFTDLHRTQLPESVRDQVDVIQVGTRDDNLAIESLQVLQTPFQDPREARVSVVVRNFGSHDGHGFLAIRVEDSTIERTGFTIPAHDARAFVSGGLPAAGLVVAHLDAEDALSVDNTAFGWVRAARPARIVLVSRSPSLAADVRTLATATANLQWSVVAPEQLTPAALRGADLAVFHGVAPAFAPDINALYVSPPADNPLFHVTGTVDGVEVLDWNARHPVLRGLQPVTTVPLRQVRVIDLPDWSEPLLSARSADREFALAFAGEHDGHRTACLGFDLATEHLLNSDNASFLLFFVNLLDWLLPSPTDATIVRAGEVVRLGAGGAAPAQVVAASGTAPVPVRDGFFEPPTVGEYRVTDGTQTRLILANFADPAESDIGRSAEPDAARVVPIAARVGATRDTPTAPATGGYRPWLYGTAIGLCLLEWFVDRRRHREERAA
jgi:hypothetical protein